MVGGEGHGVRAAVLVLVGVVVVAGLPGVAVGQEPAPGPPVVDVAPSVGPASGGTYVAARSPRFVSEDGRSLVRAVRFGTVPAVSFKVDPAESYLEALAPAHAPGRVTLSVTTSTGTVVSANEFTYTRTQGRWATLGGAVPRVDHTATLLGDGRVLVAGGCVTFTPSASPGVDAPGGSCTTASATSELYDPARRSWSRTGSMTRPRMGQAAVVLPDGRVLAVGGCAVLPCPSPGPASSSTERTAEIYDPATRHWSTTGPMAFPHLSLLAPTVTVLAAGPPSVCGPNCNKVLVVGGPDSAPHGYSDAQLYDPGRNTWTATAPTQYPRSSGQVAVLLHTGKVLVTGGITDVAITYPTVPELYDPASGSWSPTGNQEPHPGSTATVLADGRVLVTGNAVDTGPQGDEIYDPSGHPDPANPSVGGGAWIPTPAPLQLRGRSSTTLLADAKVLVTGGTSSVVPGPAGLIPGPLSTTAELYNETSRTWTSARTAAGAPPTNDNPVGGAGFPFPAGDTGLPAFSATLLKNGSVLIVGASYKQATSFTIFRRSGDSPSTAGVTPDGPSAELYSPPGGAGSGPLPLIVALILIVVAAAVVTGLVVRARRRPTQLG